MSELAAGTSPRDTIPIYMKSSLKDVWPTGVSMNYIVSHLKKDATVINTRPCLTLIGEK